MGELTLLIGNGINRTVKGGGVSWKELLIKLQNDIPETNLIDLDNEFKPFPLAFEEIAFGKPLRYDNAMKKLKMQISDVLIESLPNNLHREVVTNKKVTNILTTNYDYNLERAILIDFDNKAVFTEGKFTKERKHSIRRVNRLGQKNIWHIHGELNDPKNVADNSRYYKQESIQIGYEHYTDYVRVLQEYIFGRNNWAQYPFKHKLEKNLTLGLAWVDYFFMGKLVIIGIDLDFSEIDLWWLLNYRARMRNLYNSKHKYTFLNSEIVFIIPEISKKNLEDKSQMNSVEIEITKRKLERTKARADMLKALDVKIETIVAESFPEFYEIFIDKYL